MTSTRRGRPKATYADPYMKEIHSRPDWTPFKLETTNLRKIARWLRRAGVEVRTVQLDGRYSMLIAKAHEDDDRPDQVHDQRPSPGTGL